MDSIQLLDRKIDRATSRASQSPTLQRSYCSTFTQTDAHEHGDAMPPWTGGHDGPQEPGPRPPFAIPYHHGSEGHMMSTWPALQSLLQMVVPQQDSVSDGGERWLMKICQEFSSPLPTDGKLNILLDGQQDGQLSRVGSFDLTEVRLKYLCDVYFRSFHYLYPILDPQYFFSVTLPHVRQSNFDESEESTTVVLLVLALGEFAEQGVNGEAIISDLDGRRTGLKGGSIERPAGLVFLNAAKRGVGLTMTACTLDILHTYLLFAFVAIVCMRGFPG